MKVIISIICCFTLFKTYAQSYLGLGIQHYDAREYEEALLDFNDAEKAKSLFTDKAVSKLYFYKAMTLYHLTDIGQASSDSVLTIHQYFNKSLTLDSAWYPQINETERIIVGILIAKAEIIYKKVSKAKVREDRINGLKRFLAILNLAERLMLTPDIELKLAQGYEDLGDVYFEDSSNLSSLRKAGEYYPQAIKYYELARYNDPFSKSIIERLLMLSKRMDDPERVKEYTDLMTLAGD